MSRLIGKDSLVGDGTGYGTVVGDTTGPWSPSELSTDLLLWLDAQTEGSIVQIDSKVSQWSDLSGNDRHVTQTSASVRPTYSSDTYGSCISYASDDVLDIPSGAVTALSPETFVIIGLCNAGTSGAGYRWVYYTGNSNAASGSGQQILFHSNDTTVMYDAYDSNSNKYLASTPLNVNQDSVFSFYHDGTNLVKRQYGAQFDSDITAGTYNPATISKNQIGAPAFDGKIYSFIIANYTSAADVERLEGYICHRYGAQALLDASHPYKSVAP